MKGSTYRYLVTSHTCSVWRFWGFGFAKSHMLVERFKCSWFCCVAVLLCLCTVGTGLFVFNYVRGRLNSMPKGGKFLLSRSYLSNPLRF